MRYIFSPENKFKTWRKIWIALAEAQMEMGIVVTKQQVDDLKKYKDDINYEVAEEWEDKLRHDIMAHVKAFGDQAKSAAGIIHMGMTSCDVGDNADLIIMHQGLLKIQDKIKHFESHPWSVKADVDRLIENFEFRGLKGATGTQASFLQLCGTWERVIELEKRFTEKLGFSKVMAVTGQTYSRSIDSRIVGVLSNVVLEMCCEDHPKHADDLIRMTGYCQGASMTAATQWLERTLDDSAGRRIYLPGSFITCYEAIDKC